MDVWAVVLVALLVLVGTGWVRTARPSYSGPPMANGWLGLMLLALVLVLVLRLLGV